MSAAAIGSDTSSPGVDSVEAAVLMAQKSTVKNATFCYGCIGYYVGSHLGHGEAPETAGTALVSLALFGPLVIYSAVCFLNVSGKSKYIVRAGIGTLIGLRWSLNQNSSSNSVFAAATVVASVVVLGVE